MIHRGQRRRTNGSRRIKHARKPEVKTAAARIQGNRLNSRTSKPLWCSAKSQTSMPQEVGERQAWRHDGSLGPAEILAAATRCQSGNEVNRDDNEDQTRSLALSGDCPTSG